LETIKQLKNTIYDSQVQIRGLQQLEHKRTESLNEIEEVMRSKEGKIKLLQEELSSKIPSFEREVADLRAEQASKRRERDEFER